METDEKQFFFRDLRLSLIAGRLLVQMNHKVIFKSEHRPNLGKTNPVFVYCGLNHQLTYLFIGRKLL